MEKELKCEGRAIVHENTGVAIPPKIKKRRKKYIFNKKRFITIKQS